MKENLLYHSDVSRISKSGLDLIAKAPALYYERYLNPERPKERKTPALVEGNAFHVLTLEFPKFAHHFIVKPKFTGSGSVAKSEAFDLEHADKSIITMEQYDQIKRMRDAVLSHPIASQLLRNGVAERTLKWDDLATGAHCKCRQDWFDNDSNFIVDLKSTEDASQAGFERSSFKYRYHVQAPMYFDGSLLNNITPNGFIFIAVEKSSPYLVNVFYATEEMMQYGREVYRNDLRTYLECKRNNSWPGYEPQAKPLNLPGWVRM
jgi:exodeoxyribonuclease VIII